MNESGPNDRVLSIQTRRTLWVLAGLMLGVILWAGGGQAQSPARAQLPNPASQRLEVVSELSGTNELLDEIRQLLKSGTLHVRLEGADNPADAIGGAARTGP